MALRLIDREFTDANGRTGNYPKGVTNDIVTAKYTVEFLCTFDLSEVNQIIKKGNRFRLLSGTWEELISAFNAANIDFVLGVGALHSTTIQTVDGADLYLTDPNGHADGIYDTGRFVLTESPVSFEHYINLFNNSKGTGTKYSLIDNETQRFKVDLDNALSVFGVDTFTQYGNKSGGSIISSTVTRIADVDGNKRYEISSTFKLWLFLDDSLYNADNSIGFDTEIYAHTDLGSTISSTSISDSIKGDIGNKDESLNGGDSPWTFNSIAWTDAGANSLASFDPTQRSFFNVRIDGTFTGTELFNFRFYRVPEASEYQNKKLPVDKNVSLVTNDTLFTFATPTTKVGEQNENGAGFSVLAFTVTNNTTHVIITGSIEPNSAMIEWLKTRSKDYVFEVTIDDDSASYQRCQTVNVVCDESTAVVNVLPLGVYTTSTFLMEDVNGADVGVSPVLMTEDYVRLSSTFTLPKDPDENVWKSIELKVVAVKNTGEEFDLESFIYDVSNLPAMRDGKISLNYSVDRGYKLPSTSDKNEVFVRLLPALDDVSNFGVEVSYPFRVRNESWLPQPNASDDFFGEKTQDWYTYSNDADWSVEARIVLKRDTGTYTNPFDFTISKGTALTVFSYEKLDGTPITKPLASETVKVIATVTAPTDWTTDLWGVISVRETDTVPTWEISTLEDPTDNNNPLEPIFGETRLKIDSLAKSLTFTCLYNPAKLNPKLVTFGCRAHGNTL